MSSLAKVSYCWKDYFVYLTLVKLAFNNTNCSGIARVGKTSLLLRYCRNVFDGGQESTLNASFLEKKILVSGIQMNMNIWDTAGQERYHALNAVYYREAAGALIVYD